MKIEERLLAALPGTALQLSLRIFTVHSHTLAVIRRLRSQLYISSWRKGVVGPPAAVYARGSLPDAERPKPMSAAAKCRRYRRNLQTKHGENYGLVQAAQKRKIPGRKIVVGGKVIYQQ